METVRLLRIADLFNKGLITQLSTRPIAFFLIIALLELGEGDRPLKYPDKHDLRSNFC